MYDEEEFKKVNHANKFTGKLIEVPIIEIQFPIDSQKVYKASYFLSKMLMQLLEDFILEKQSFFKIKYMLFYWQQQFINPFINNYLIPKTQNEVKPKFKD